MAIKYSEGMKHKKKLDQFFKEEEEKNLEDDADDNAD